jgi:hypothetical protein
MEITTRGLWTLVHGMGFGALYLLACSGALVELYRLTSPGAATMPREGSARFLRVYLLVMVVLAWLTVLSGAYAIYPWYRAVAPAGTTDLSAYPQMLLRSHPATAGWHTLGMEWKEHVAWLVPISITMVAAVFFRYGRALSRHRGLRSAVLGYTLVSFLAAAVAAFFGAMLNKTAPTQGGATIHLSGGR